MFIHGRWTKYHFAITDGSIEILVVANDIDGNGPTLARNDGLGRDNYGERILRKVLDDCSGLDRWLLTCLLVAKRVEMGGSPLVAAPIVRDLLGVHGRNTAHTGTEIDAFSL